MRAVLDVLDRSPFRDGGPSLALIGEGGDVSISVLAGLSYWPICHRGSSSGLFTCGDADSKRPPHFRVRS
ncbi:hypothetical protein ACFPRL_35860 [Pseudoclavibacter helvolus]